MVLIEYIRPNSKKIDAKLCQCILHGKAFLVMHWIITLSCLQLTLLTTDDSLCAVCIVVHQRAADCEIAGVTDHMEWYVLVCNLPSWRSNQALLDAFKGTLTIRVP